MVKNFFKTDTEEDRSKSFTKIFTNLVNKSEEMFTFFNRNNIIEDVDNLDWHHGGDRNE